MKYNRLGLIAAMSLGSLVTCANMASAQDAKESKGGKRGMPSVQERLDRGRVTPLEATKAAMKDVGGPVVAIALVLVAVFVPVAFLGGLTASSTSSSRLRSQCPSACRRSAH